MLPCHMRLSELQSILLHPSELQPKLEMSLIRRDNEWEALVRRTSIKDHLYKNGIDEASWIEKAHFRKISSQLQLKTDITSCFP